MGGLFSGIFGRRMPTPAGQQTVPAEPWGQGPGGPGPVPQQAPQHDPSRRIFGDGSVGGIIGGVGKILSYGPFVGMAQEGINRRRTIEDSNMAYKDAMARHAMQPDTTDIARDAVSMGMKPGTPEYNDFIMKYRMKPSFMMMGSPETGQTIVNPAAPAGGDAVPQEAVDRLRQNPAEAAQFDQVFGPGASQRALAGGR